MRHSIVKYYVKVVDASADVIDCTLFNSGLFPREISSKETSVQPERCRFGVLISRSMADSCIKIEAARTCSQRPPLSI